MRARSLVVVFGHGIDTDRRRPAGRLGPRYRIAYSFSGDGDIVVVQDVYPYAAVGLLSHTAGGQRIWRGSPRRTRGGWIRLEDSAIPQLVALSSSKR